MKESRKLKFDSPCFCFHLRRAGRAVGQFYERYFQELDLRSGQFGLLAAISRLEKLSIGELSSAMGMDQTTATRNVELLARKGLVNLEPDPEDARRKALSLTAAGAEKLREAEPHWRQAQTALAAGLGEKEAQKLLQLLGKLVKAVGE